MRPAVKIYEQCDLLHCLEWAARDSGLRNVPTKLDLELIQERRRAIEWVAGAEADWDAIPMDTGSGSEIPGP